MTSTRLLAFANGTSHPLSGILNAEDARRVARCLQADERGKYREAGRRKLEEFRRRKQLSDAHSDQAATVNAAKDNQSPDSLSDIIQLLPLDQSAALAKLSQDSSQQSASRDTSGKLSQPDRDPMVDVLAAQIKSLMQDKQRLQQEASRLLMENEQLQELVGFLTVQLEGSSAVPEDDEMFDFTPEELQYAERHQQQEHQQLYKTYVASYQTTGSTGAGSDERHSPNTSSAAHAVAGELQQQHSSEYTNHRARASLVSSHESFSPRNSSEVAVA